MSGLRDMEQRLDVPPIPSTSNTGPSERPIAPDYRSPALDSRRGWEWGGVPCPSKCVLWRGVHSPCLCLQVMILRKLVRVALPSFLMVLGPNIA